MVSVAAKYDLDFLKKEHVAKDTSSFFFQRPEKLDFLPGQFMRLILDLPLPTDRGSGRFFSIASSPTEKEYLMITVRTSPQIYKKTLLNLMPGNKIQISLPYGVFTLKPEEPQPYIFLAGGIGITPFRSMIRYSADLNFKRPITLISSFSTVEEIVFQAEMQTIAQNHTWLKLVQTITQPEKSNDPWRGNIGRIDENLIKKNVVDITSSVFYLAGPPAMVDSMFAIVKSLGVEENRIRREKFTGY